MMRPRPGQRAYRADRLASLASRALQFAGPAHRLVARLATLGLAGMSERLEEWLDRRNPQDRDAALLCAMFAWARDDLSAAEDHARRAVALAPKRPFARTFLASVLRDRDRIERALAVLGAEQPDQEALPLLLARIGLHRRRGDDDRARALAEAAAARFPDTYAAVQQAVALRLETGALEEALHAAEAACAAFPGHASAWMQHALILERAGDPHGAAAVVRRALEIDPGLRPAQLLMMRVMGFEGRREEARRLFAEVIRARGALGPADHDFLIDAAVLAGTEPPPRLLRRLAAAAGPGPRFVPLVSLAQLGQARAAAEGLARLFGEGAQDDRVIALAAQFGDELAPHLERTGMPPLRQIQRRMMLDAQAALRNDAGLTAADALIRDILEGEPGDDPRGPLVSYICPIHRPQDVANLLAQVSRQAWRKAEVVFCINGDGIAEQDLALDPALGFAVRHLRLPPGRPVGFYLARAIACASGDYVLRIDADDIYDADYTRCMVGYLRRHGADIASLYPYVFYLEDIGQTFLASAIREPPVRDIARGNRQAAGSGSSLCARREVFERVGFDEALALGEDVVFYRRAAAAGFRVHLLPGYLHTAVRRADKSAHTWRSDDFRVLSGGSRFLAEGCHVLRPGVAPPATSADPFAGLFDAPVFRAFGELRIADALRTMPAPIDLLVPAETSVPARDDELLRVLRQPDGATARGRQAIAVLPREPEAEAALADRHGALSFCYDVLPRLIVHDTAAFRRLGGIRRSDAAEFRDRFDRARLRYAVLANPRTGSEHLCSLLESFGLGRPTELIRHPAATLLARSAEPLVLMRTLLGMVEAEGVIGTKLITQYILDGTLDDRIEALLAWMVETGFSFVWIRRPEAHSAVSAYVAARRGVWHHVSPREADAAAKQHMPPYDFQAIAEHMKRLLAWSKRLSDLTARIVPPERMITIGYAALAQDPERPVRRIAGFLGFRPLPGTVPVSANRRVSEALPAINDYRARFEQEWKARALGTPVVGR